jgi:hypothetical protein
VGRESRSPLAFGAAPPLEPVLNLSGLVERSREVERVVYRLEDAASGERLDDGARVAHEAHPPSTVRRRLDRVGFSASLRTDKDFFRLGDRPRLG